MHRLIANPIETRRLSSCLLLAFMLAGCGAVACASRDAGSSVAAPVADEEATRFAHAYEADHDWPTRIWLETPLMADASTVLVPARRMGVLIHLYPDGRARVDFGRYGAHTVPVTQTNFTTESERQASGAATKIFPNLLGMLMNRVVDTSTEALRPKQLAADDIRGGLILLAFADTREADIGALDEFASHVEGAGDVRLVVFIPITDELDGDVHDDLRAGGWRAPFVMTPMAGSYVQAMLEPGTPRPHARLCTDEGRILAEGSPDAATLEAMVAALASTGD